MSLATTKAAWVAVDWGTSHLRAWPMSAAGEPLEVIPSDLGMGKIRREDYEAVLQDLLSDVLPETGTLPVVICGMAGSRQGWVEAPYASAPCAPPSAVSAAKPRVEDPRLEVFILPGVKQPSPADVMRGEETQIAGVLAQRAGFDGVICLPGTHTKWVSVAEGQIQSFGTYMTGELFALISTQSVLRHSVAQEGWSEASFSAGCRAAQEAPAGYANAMFALRAESLLDGLTPVDARSYLSGLLVGAEIAATKDRWANKPVVIVGASGIAGAYAAALKEQGAGVDIADAQDITLAGLRAAYSQLVKE